MHYEVSAAGYKKLVTELMFEGDPRMTPQNWRSFENAGFVIAKLEPGEVGGQECVCDLVLRKE